MTRNVPGHRVNLCGGSARGAGTAVRDLVTKTGRKGRSQALRRWTSAPVARDAESLSPAGLFMLGGQSRPVLNAVAQLVMLGWLNGRDRG
jgi:hypothetical protein